MCLLHRKVLHLCPRAVVGERCCRVAVVHLKFDVDINVMILCAKIYSLHYVCLPFRGTCTVNYRKWQKNPINVRVSCRTNNETWRIHHIKDKPPTSSSDLWCRPRKRRFPRFFYGPSGLRRKICYFRPFDPPKPSQNGFLTWDLFFHKLNVCKILKT